MCTNLKLSRILLVAVALLAAMVISYWCLTEGAPDIFKTEGKSYNTDDYGYVAYDNNILLRTDRRIYNDLETMIGMLINLSSHPIEIGTYEPLIYEFTDVGWMPPMGVVWTMLMYGRAYENDRVQPGGVLPVGMGFLLAKTLPQYSPWRVLEQPYVYNENEYVVYSNEILIVESSQPSRFRKPPPDLNDTLLVDTEMVAPYTVILTNDSDAILWYNPFCSNVDLDDQRPTDYQPFTTLQRQTGEGTWQVLRPSKERCTMVKEPIRIGPGGTVELYVGDGYPSPDELDPGVYRWHLVNYIDPFPECNAPDSCFLTGAHLFTDTFEP